LGQPFVGEIRIFAGNFAPNGWAFCHGQLLAISENEVLFQLIGTTYGGDGQSTFGLPDLRGRVPIHQGQGPGLNNRQLSQAGGAENVTLLASQLPMHGHTQLVSAAPALSRSPQGNLPAIAQGDLYSTGAPSIAMAASAITQTGGNQPHENMQPYLGLNFIISLFGIFPTQS
jgi:microcystin-dependent protein